MNNLVQIENDHAFTTTLIIAEGVQIEHRAVMKLLDTHIDRPMFSGLEVRRLPAKYRGKPTRYFKLTFPQALTLVSFMKNSDRVALLKIEMIKRGEEASIAAIISSFDYQDVPEDRYVYVARETVSGRYKIGISKDPERRVKELNIGNPEELLLVHAFLAVEPRHRSETLAHKTFTEHRLRSEWFDKHIRLNKLPSYVEGEG